jgi:succinyl-CoA synthetase alpha subunit
VPAASPAPGRSRCSLSGDVVGGCASYYMLGAPAGEQAEHGPAVTAEIALAVADHMHHRGIATLLLEHLVSAAARHQVQAFTAETLAENTAMLKVFADVGLPVHRQYADGVMELTFPLPRVDVGPALDTYLDAVAGRERSADATSLRHMFAPESVVVIGASRRPGPVGRAILGNIRTGGYLGRLFAVNPHAPQIGGVPCWPAVADLPEPPDLAVIAMPMAAVLDTVEQCGRRGMRSVVVITSGLDKAGCAALFAACRRNGMRLVDPNCFGVAIPGISVDATFAASHPRPGPVGVVSQSGGLGFAKVDQLSRLGIGISSFASVGNKLDVSSNDLLLWWQQDGLTKLAVLYIESFGNPRKFTRTARRIGATMPVLTVYAGRSAAGPRAAASHTAAVATPLVSREALFEQAGIVATPGLGELMEVTALLATQPVPAGETVAIVSNAGGSGVLTADACTDLGLAVHHPDDHVRDKLRALLPGSTITGLVRETDVGAVQLDLRTEADVCGAYRTLQTRFSDRLRLILVQPMTTSGTEADTLIRSLRSARLLLGPRGGPPGAARDAAAGLAARRRPARNHRPRPQSGHRPSRRGLRRGRPGQGGSLSARRPLPAQTQLTDDRTCRADH